MFLEAAVEDIAKYKTFILQICGGTKERRQIFFFLGHMECQRKNKIHY